MGEPRVPTSRGTHRVPVGVHNPPWQEDRLTVSRPSPPLAVQQVLNELYSCPDCGSEVHWDLKVGVAHDPDCPRQKGVT